MNITRPVYVVKIWPCVPRNHFDKSIDLAKYKKQQNKNVPKDHLNKNYEPDRCTCCEETTNLINCQKKDKSTMFERSFFWQEQIVKKKILKSVMFERSFSTRGYTGVIKVRSIQWNDNGQIWCPWGVASDNAVLRGVSDGQKSL